LGRIEQVAVEEKGANTENWLNTDDRTTSTPKAGRQVQEE
jgi:hypothetical protein